MEALLQRRMEHLIWIAGGSRTGALGAAWDPGLDVQHSGEGENWKVKLLNPSSAVSKRILGRIDGSVLYL